MAWMGMRPLAMSWPPARRAAEANGAAHEFSHTSTPAVVPGSMAAARWAMSSAASSSAIWVSATRRSSCGVQIGDLGGLDRPVRALLQDQQIEHPDELGVHQPADLGRHLASKIRDSRWELDHQVVHWSQFVDVYVSHDVQSLIRGRRRASHCRGDLVQTQATAPPEVGQTSAMRLLDPVRSFGDVGTDLMGTGSRVGEGSAESLPVGGRPLSAGTAPAGPTRRRLGAIPVGGRWLGSGRLGP